MKKSIKIFTVFLLAISFMSVSVMASSLDRKTLIEKEIQELSNSDNPVDHIRAVKLMKSINQEVYIENFDFTALTKDLSQTDRKLAEDTLIKDIESLSKLNDSILKEMGCLEEQINAIKNFDGTLQSAILASPTLSVYGGFTNYVKGSSQTTVKMISAFQWTGTYISYNGKQDIFATVWTLPMFETSENGYVNYKKNNSSDILPTYPPLIASDLNGGYMIFNKIKSGYTLYAGSIITQLKANSYEPNVGGFCSYGKSTTDVSPSAAASGQGLSVGITFSKNVLIAGTDRFQAY